MTTTSVPLGSPPRTIWQRSSPRVGSPLAILHDAKEFLASSPEMPSRLRPCLDPYRTPFGGSGGGVVGTPSGVGGGGAMGSRPGSVAVGSRPGSVDGGVPGGHGGGHGDSRESYGMSSGPMTDSRDSLHPAPRRLPSLTMEEFSAMKRREGLESRSSEPGARGFSRNGSRSKRRQQQAAGHESGAKSAPASRGTEVAEPLSPMWPPEAPMTEPSHTRATHSPMMRRPPSEQTPTRSSSMACLQQGSSRRPPHPPKRRSVDSRDRARQDSPCASPSLLATPLPHATPLVVEDFSPTGATPMPMNGYGRGQLHSPSPSAAAGRRSGVGGNSGGYPMTPLVPELPLKRAQQFCASVDALGLGSGRSCVASGRSTRSMLGGGGPPRAPSANMPLAAPRDLAPRELVQALADAASSARGRASSEVEDAPSIAAAASRARRAREGGDREGSPAVAPPAAPCAGPSGGSASSSSRPRGTSLTRGGDVAPTTPAKAAPALAAAAPAPPREPVRRASSKQALIPADECAPMDLGDAEAAALLAEMGNDAAERSYGWDGDDSEPASLARTGRVLSNLSCSRGPRGVTALSVTGSTLAGEAAKAMMASGKFSEDPASPGAVKGKNGPAWVRGEIIGHGSLGQVFLALNQTTGQIFAVKEVRFDQRDKADLTFKQALENEISICKELHHPRIVSYLGHDDIESSLYIYLEYMPGGSITQVLSQFGAFDESLIATYTRDLLEGLNYLHTRQPVVLHRDVKGANILVGLESRVKLSDFGCSKRTADTLSQSLRGSIPWMAPEVIQQTGYGRRSDVWSLGCVVIEMATAKHPWGHFDNPMAAMVKIGMSKETPPLPRCVSEICKSFIGRCTQRDKNLRPTAAELLRHEFVANVMDDEPP